MTEKAAVIRATAAKVSLAEFLKGRPSRNVITLKNGQTIGDALQILARGRILGAPLLDEATGKYLGFVDVGDIISAFIQGLPAHSKPHQMLATLDLLATAGPEFTKRPLSSVRVGHDGELFYRALAGASLLELIEHGFLKPASGSSICHRVAMFDVDADGKVHISNVLSQTDLARWILYQIETGAAGEVGSATLQDLGLIPKDVLCVLSDRPALEAFSAMLHAGLHTVGVCNAAGKDAQLVGSIGLRNLRQLTPESFGSLALPTGEFLAVQTGTVYSSAGHSHGAGEPGHHLDKREQMLQHHALVSVPHDATFAQAVEKMVVAKAHEVFVLDADSKPVSVITPSDLLKVVAGPAAA